MILTKTKCCHGCKKTEPYTSEHVHREPNQQCTAEVLQRLTRQWGTAELNETGCRWETKLTEEEWKGVTGRTQKPNNKPQNRKLHTSSTIDTDEHILVVWFLHTFPKLNHRHRNITLNPKQSPLNWNYFILRVCCLLKKETWLLITGWWKQIYTSTRRGSGCVFLFWLLVHLNKSGVKAQRWQTLTVLHLISACCIQMKKCRAEGASGRVVACCLHTSCFHLVMDPQNARCGYFYLWALRVSDTPRYLWKLQIC